MTYEKALRDLAQGIRDVMRENGIEPPKGLARKIAAESLVRASHHGEAMGFPSRS